MNKILRDKSRRILNNKYEIKRLEYKYMLYTLKSNSLKENIQKKLELLPRDSSITRIKNFCVFTGRGKGIYKNFKMSRIKFRELALTGQLPGVRKASW